MSSIASFRITLDYHSLNRVLTMLRTVERVTCFARLALKQRSHSAGLASDGNRCYVTQFVLVQDFENWLGAKTLVQKHASDADFERFQAFNQPAHNIGHLFPIFDKVQRHHIAPIIPHNRNGSIAMKMGRPRFWQPAHNLLFVVIRFPMIRDQRQVNRNVEVALTFPDTRMQLLPKQPVQHALHSGSIWQGLYQHLPQTIARWRAL